jgi:hypothetical protein
MHSEKMPLDYRSHQANTGYPRGAIALWAALAGIAASMIAVLSVWFGEGSLSLLAPLIALLGFFLGFICSICTALLLLLDGRKAKTKPDRFLAALAALCLSVCCLVFGIIYSFHAPGLSGAGLH